MKQLELSGFIHARIQGDFDLLGARIAASNGYALICDEAVIGRLLFRESPQTGFRIPVTINGSVSFNSSQVNTLVDDYECWEAATHLDLDNFRYGKIAASSPSDVNGRLAWLKKQRPDYLSVNFAHQPWERLAQIYEEAKRDEEAKIVRMQMRARQRCARWKNQKTVIQKAKWFALTRFDWLLGTLVGYGYRPWRAFWALALIWIAGALLFSYAAKLGVMIPSDPKIYADTATPEECRLDWGHFAGPELPSAGDLSSMSPVERHKADQNLATDTDRRSKETKRIDPNANSPLSWHAICTRSIPADYANFSAVLYSLDLIVPLLDLNMKKRWTQKIESTSSLSTGHLIRLWQWFELLSGLFLSLLLAATVSGIIKK